ncbi:hypothetical protein Pelo_4576 [Pelomyxa schiedti]|nr:hypothetical protein Pelo_4576 [Pelomyxa schiedti]
MSTTLLSSIFANDEAPSSAALPQRRQPASQFSTDESAAYAPKRRRLSPAEREQRAELRKQILRRAEADAGAAPEADAKRAMTSSSKKRQQRKGKAKVKKEEDDGAAEGENENETGQNAEEERLRKEAERLKKEQYRKELLAARIQAAAAWHQRFGTALSEKSRVCGDMHALRRLGAKCSAKFNTQLTPVKPVVPFLKMSSEPITKATANPGATNPSETTATATIETEATTHSDENEASDSDNSKTSTPSFLVDWSGHTSSQSETTAPQLPTLQGIIRRHEDKEFFSAPPLVTGLVKYPEGQVGQFLTTNLRAKKKNKQRVPTYRRPKLNFRNW